MPARGPGPRRAGAKLARASLIVGAFLGAGALAAACAGSPGPGVASIGKSKTTGSRSSPTRSGGASGSEHNFFAYVSCMRRHGEPNMPYPTVSDDGGQVSVNLSLAPSSGLDPRSPRFAAASKACMHLLPKPSSVARTLTITPRDRTDYLKAAACMRSHGFSDFPDPVFRDGNVTFDVPKSVDARSPRFLSAVTTCEKLIPAGLPYSSPSSS